MADPYKGHRKTLDSVSDNAHLITPSDATDLAVASRALYVGTGGDIQLELTESAAPIVFKNVQTGSVLPLRVKRVYASLTTATDLVALL